MATRKATVHPWAHTIGSAAIKGTEGRQAQGSGGGWGRGKKVPLIANVGKSFTIHSGKG